MTADVVLLPPEWITANEGAELAQMTVDALRTHRLQGNVVGYDASTGEQLPAAPMRGTLRFRREDIVELFESLHPWTIVPVPRSWVKRARCAGMTTAERDRIFFPDVGETFTEAFSYCQACPVRLACLQWAAMVGAEGGMYGGTSGHKLRKFASAWRKRGELPLICDLCGTSYLPGDSNYCSLKCREADVCD